MAEKTELEDTLVQLIARRGPALSVPDIMDWLKQAEGYIFGVDSGRLTAWGVHMLRLLLDALVEYSRVTGGIPEPIAAWIEEHLVPSIFGTNLPLSAAEQEVVRGLVRLLVKVQYRMCEEPPYDVKAIHSDATRGFADEYGQI